jgi:hypothetical protein
VRVQGDWERSVGMGGQEGDCEAKRGRKHVNHKLKKGRRRIEKLTEVDWRWKGDRSARVSTEGFREGLTERFDQEGEEEEHCSIKRGERIS